MATPELAPYFLTGNHAGSALKVPLQDGEQTLGRSSECDATIPAMSVSKRHAIVIVSGDRVVLRDLGSKNGTFVNGKQVREDTEVQVGDTIALGSVTLVLAEGDSTTVSRLLPDGAVRTQYSTTMEDVLGKAKAEPRTAQMLEAMHEGAQMLARRLDVPALYDGVLELLGRFIKADRILIFRSEEGQPMPRVVASRTAGAHGDDPLSISGSMMREVLEKGRSLLTADAATDSRFSAQQSVIFSGIHSAMAAPLFDNDRILGLIYADSRERLVVYAEEELRLLTLLANMTAVKLTNCRLEEVERERERLVQEMDLATRIQRNLLPKVIESPDGYDIYGTQIPCHEVGGDLYDVRRRADGRVWLVLGDVTGKGMGAALLMANVMAGLQILGEDVEAPGVLTDRLGRYLTEHVEVGQFVTLFVGLLDPQTGHVVYSNAAQNPPVVVGPGGQRRLDTTGPPLALVPGMEIGSAEMTIAPGESLLLYSDGLSESEADGVQYDEGPFDIALQGAELLGAEELARKVLDDAERFRSGVAALDDLTILVIRRKA